MVVGRSHTACTDQRPWVILEHYERALRETDLVLEVSARDQNCECLEDARSTRERLRRKIAALECP